MSINLVNHLRFAAVGIVFCFAQTTMPIFAQSAGVPPPNFKVAFIGGQGFGENARAVLHLIKAEGAQAVIHQGDFDYDHNPSGWDQMISDSLGANFPYFASIGDADTDDWDGPTGYQQYLKDRAARVGVTWDGDLGIKSSLYYNGLFIILTAPDIRDTGHDIYIRHQLAVDNSIWRICSWHKNMRLMQVANKTDETGWDVYEESRLGGAIIATGHSHTYSRTHLLSSMQNQTVAGTSNTLNLEKGKTFVFVHEIAGQGIRAQELSGNWWASIYTKTQGAKYGALFGAFNVDGMPNKAAFYMKTIDGKLIDSFTVISNVTPLTPAVTLTAPNGGELWETGATRNSTWTNVSFSDPVKIEYSPDGGANWTVLASSVPNAGTYAWTINASPTTQGRIRVSDAVDGNPGDASDNNFTISNVPSAPGNLAATAKSSSTIDLSWSDNSSVEEGYKIERKAGNQAFGEITAVGANVKTYSDTGLDPSTAYTYRVRAYHANGNSAYSNEAAATTSSSGGGGDPNINLALKKPASASSSISSYPPSKAVDGSTKSYWRSASISSNPTVWFQVDLQSVQTIGRIKVRWFKTYHAREFQGQASQDGTTWITLFSETNGKSGDYESVFTQTNARYLRLTMTKNNQSTYRINEFEIYSGAATNASMRAEIADGGGKAASVEFTLLQNYPNPLNPSTNISFSLPGEAHLTLKIFNLLGEEVATLVDGLRPAGNHTVLFDAKHLPSGLYFAVLQAGEVRQVRRIVVMK